MISTTLAYLRDDSINIGIEDVFNNSISMRFLIAGSEVELIFKDIEQVKELIRKQNECLQAFVEQIKIKEMK